MSIRNLFKYVRTKDENLNKALLSAKDQFDTITRAVNAGTEPSEHALVGDKHTASGLTAGHFLKAASPTTFGFAAHGLGPGDIGAPPTSRLISTTPPLSGGGDLSANRMFALAGLSSMGLSDQWIKVNHAGTAWEYRKGPFYDTRDWIVSDGSTDDTAGWATLMAAVVAAGGGTIWFFNTGNPSIITNTGTMEVLITFPSKVSLVGIGMPTIKLKSGSTTTDFLKTAATPENVDVHIEGITIDGNKAGQSPSLDRTMVGLLLDNCRRSTVERVYVKDVYGVDWTVTEAIGIGLINSHDCAVDRCWASGVDGMGIYCGDASINSSRLTIANSWVWECASYGFSVWNTKDVIFANDHSYSNVGAINAEDCARIHITGFHAYLNTRLGIWLNETCDSEVVGCESYNNGSAAYPGPGIYVCGSSGYKADRNLVLGNRCYDDRGTQYQTYGCQEGTYADYNIFTWNHVNGNLTGGVLIVSSTSRSTGNFTTDYLPSDFGRVKSIQSSHHFELVEGSNDWYNDLVSNVWRLHTGGNVKFGIDSSGYIRTPTTSSGTTLGSVAKKMPIYDVSGNLLGYIPIYDSIT